MLNQKAARTKAFLIILPSAVAIAIFVYAFIGWSVAVSFSSWWQFNPDFAFQGFRNYVDVFSTERFQIDLWNTLFFTLLFIGLTIGGGLGLAVLLDKSIKGEGFFRTILLFPMALSFVVTGVVWGWLFKPTYGINLLLQNLGLKDFAFGWYTDPAALGSVFHVGLIAIVVAASWQFMGYAMALYLAGIRAIPEEVREAAKIDGASGTQMFWRIIFPLLRPITLSAAIILGHISLKIFDLVYTISSNGGPGFSIDVPGINMFNTAFHKTNYAQGAVISTVMLLMVVIVIVPYFYSRFRKEKGAGNGN